VAGVSRWRGAGHVELHPHDYLTITGAGEMTVGAGVMTVGAGVVTTAGTVATAADGTVSTASVRLMVQPASTAATAAQAAIGMRREEVRMEISLVFG
jgi:hypothetical protein